MEETNVVSAMEAERFVEDLRSFDVESVGSKAFFEEHERLEKLNLQAHANAVANRDPFVMEALLTFGKMDTLVHELMAIEIWKEKVAPLLADEMLQADSIRSYVLLYHEATVSSLLECILFNKEALDAAEDSLLDLVDWCQRKIVRLVASKDMSPPKVGRETAKDMLAQTAADIQREQAAHIEFNVSLAAFTILRFITDHIADLPLSVMTRVLNTHDMPSLLVNLVDRAPWLARSPAGMFKWIDGKWQKIQGADLRKLCKVEAQAWLALNNLLCDGECRKKYQYGAHNQQTILKLRNHFSDVLLDQIPPLADLRRAIEEIQLMAPPEATKVETSLVIEQVPHIRDALMHRRDWKAIADAQRVSIFQISEDDRRAEMERMAAMYSLDAYADVMEQPNCAQCGIPAVKRCSRCKTDWYCGRECQVKAWKAHKPMCDMLCKAAAAAAAAAESGGSA